MIQPSCFCSFIYVSRAHQLAGKDPSPQEEELSSCQSRTIDGGRGVSLNRQKKSLMPISCKFLLFLHRAFTCCTDATRLIICTHFSRTAHPAFASSSCRAGPRCMSIPRLPPPSTSWARRKQTQIVRQPSRQVQPRYVRVPALSSDSNFLCGRVEIEDVPSFRRLSSNLELGAARVPPHPLRPRPVFFVPAPRRERIPSSGLEHAPAPPPKDQRIIRSRSSRGTHAHARGTPFKP